MSTVIYIALATIVGIGVAALFESIEEFPEIDSVGEYSDSEPDEHERLAE